MRFLRFAVLCVVLPVLADCLFAAEIAPAQKRLVSDGEWVGSYSNRTLVAAVEIDRDRMRLLGYTAKIRPFKRQMSIPDPHPYLEHRSLQAEVILRGPEDESFTQRIDVGSLCFSHPFGTEDHIAGDTIRVHRDAFIVELPEIAGFDRLDVAFYEPDGVALSRRSLGRDRLDSSRFSAAAGPLAYGDLAIANESAIPQVPAASDLLWPEDFGDPEIFRVDGEESESGRRVNIVIVPDGYTYADKALMESHADAMIAEFRNRTPYKEHDPFINYTLVYAYSTDSGTDECDCGVVKNTAMATRFPSMIPSCGNQGNRCLYYTSGCEPSAVNNITEAELRAPAHDETVIMVNTTRYGGCGGTRAVYSAGNLAATLIAVHEVGHTLGDLDDEYVSKAGCGSHAGGVNTSTDGVEGNWTEWIDEIGPPIEGAQYWDKCVFRPEQHCMMRTLGPEFCKVCNQHWSLVYFGHPRVSPTAPIESRSPTASEIIVQPGTPIEFSLQTRLAVGTQNQIVWTIDTPTTPETTVGSSTDSLTHTFSEEGQYSVNALVIADTDFIKPSRNGPNVDSVNWQVSVQAVSPPGEVSPSGGVPFHFVDGNTAWWEASSDVGVVEYRVYRGDPAGLASGDAGDCLLTGLTAPSAQLPGNPPSGSTYFFLVTSVNAAGEGPLGGDSSGNPRIAGTPCEF